MRIYTYKNCPAINLDLVQSFCVDEKSDFSGGKVLTSYFVSFLFDHNNTVWWRTESREESINVYNAIIDSLTKEYQNHTHII